MKKLLVLVVAVILVFSFATTTFASTTTLNSTEVFGGTSQELTTDFRDRTSNMCLNVSYIIWNGQTGWKIKGYSHYDGTASSALISITGTGNYYSTYTNYPQTMTVKTSIASSLYYQFMMFDGTLYL